MGAAFNLASKLGGAKPNGRGGLRAFCPVHEADGGDHDPSLDIDEKNGKLLVHCRAGCDQKEVMAALRALEVWPNSNGAGLLKAVAAIWKPTAPTVEHPVPLAHPKRG